MLNFKVVVIIGVFFGIGCVIVVKFVLCGCCVFGIVCNIVCI